MLLRRRLPTLLVLVISAVILTSPVATGQTEGSDPVLQATITDSVAATAASIQPVSDVRVEDRPNDAGGSVIVSWSISPDDRPGGLVTGYRVERAESLTDLSQK